MGGSCPKPLWLRRNHRRLAQSAMCLLTANFVEVHHLKRMMGALLVASMKYDTITTRLRCENSFTCAKAVI